MAIQNTFYLDVDIKRDNYVEEPQVTQNDNIAFVLRLTDDGIDKPIEGVSTYTLASLRADGQSVLTVGTLTGPNEVTFELGSTEVSVPGRVKAAIQLYDVDGRVSSIPFTYEVTKDLATNYVPSKDEQTLIELVLGEGPVILAEARQATANAIQATSDLTVLKTEVIDATANANTAANHATTEGDRASTQADRADTAATNAEGVYNAILPVLPNIEGWGYDPIPYDPATTYEKNNIVSHDGSTYISLVDNNVGNTPTLATPNANWGVLARRGIDGMGAVSSVNGVGPDASGDVQIDLSGLATKEELRAVAIDVKDFGAIGDGITDDTISIQTALNFANENKMSLLFTQGIYIYTSNLNVQGEIKSIVGSGEVKLNQVGTGYVGVSIIGTQNLKVENILFTGDLTNETTMIWLQDSHNFKMINCRFIDTGSSCISLSKNVNTIIKDCYFKNTGKTAQTNVTHPSKPSIWVGEYPTYTNTNVSISNCIFDETNWSGIYFFPHGGIIRDCVFNSCGESSIFVDYETRDISIVNNKIDNSKTVNIAGFGIELGGVIGCLIDSNTISNCDEAGIALAKMDEFVISNNRCINNGKGNGSAEQKAGLVFRLIGGNCIGGTIAGNIFTDNRNTGKTQLYGISTMRYDNTEFYISGTLFSNNYLSGNVNKSLFLFDEGALIGDGNLFANNFGYADRPKTIVIDSGTDTGIKNIVGFGFRPRHIRIEGYSLNPNGKSIAEIDMIGKGISKNIVQYGNTIATYDLAWAILDDSGTTKNYAEISGLLNDGFMVNIGYAEISVKLLITCYP